MPGTSPASAAFSWPSLLHPCAWPKDGIEFAGKRVGIIGTGATAVQTIQTIAKTVGHLTVCATHAPISVCAPLHNGKISRRRWTTSGHASGEIFALSRNLSPGCYIHAPDPRKTLETAPEDREAFWETLYNSPGFGVWMGQFSDTLTDREANRLASDFIAKKIRQRVKDPAVAEKLIPKNHGLGMRRVPLETGYYEVYNQPNVELVDIGNERRSSASTPDRHPRPAIREREFDIIIYATGFDAITGAFDRIDISGVDGVRLKDVWKDGPQTYLGVLEGKASLTALMAMGPHTPASVITRAPRNTASSGSVRVWFRFATKGASPGSRRRLPGVDRMDRTTSWPLARGS